MELLVGYFVLFGVGTGHEVPELLKGDGVLLEDIGELVDYTLLGNRVSLELSEILVSYLCLGRIG